MKPRIDNQVSFGLLMLAMFIIAFVAGQREAGDRDRIAFEHAVGLDGGLHGSVAAGIGHRIKGLRVLRAPRSGKSSAMR